jgi:hypothetical protein
MSMTESRPRAPSRAAIYRQFQATALCPKPKAMSYAELYGEKIQRRVTGDEIDLLAWIADNADSLTVEGETYAVVRMPAHMIDKLARIGEALADLEPGGDLDPGRGEGTGGIFHALLQERRGHPDTGDDSDWSLDANEQGLRGGYSPGTADFENTYNETINQERLLAAGMTSDDLEDDHDREAVNEDGDPLDEGEFDPAEYGEPEEDTGVAPSPELVARKRAIVAARREAGEPRQRHTTIATNVETGEQHEIEWIRVGRPFPAADAMPVPVKG